MDRVVHYLIPQYLLRIATRADRRTRRRACCACAPTVALASSLVANSLSVGAAFAGSALLLLAEFRLRSVCIGTTSTTWAEATTTSPPIPPGRWWPRCKHPWMLGLAANALQHDPNTGVQLTGCTDMVRGRAVRGPDSRSVRRHRINRSTATTPAPPFPPGCGHQPNASTIAATRAATAPPSGSTKCGRSREPPSPRSASHTASRSES